MTKILGEFFNKFVPRCNNVKETQKNEKQIPDKNATDKDLKKTSQCQSSYGKALIRKKKNVENLGLTQEEIQKLRPEEKQTKLDKAGFTQDIIADLKQKNTLYGPKLIDEALNMAIYLDAEYARGTKITMQLLDEVIEIFSLGASGGSAATQLRILAENWTHGKEIKQAYK